MSNVTKYAFTGLIGVALITLVFMPFLDPAGRRGLVIAALIALPIQIIAFSAMLSFRSDWNRFLAVWVGGVFGWVSKRSFPNDDSEPTVSH